VSRHTSAFAATDPLEEASLASFPSSPALVFIFVTAKMTAEDGCFKSETNNPESGGRSEPSASIALAAFLTLTSLFVVAIAAAHVLMAVAMVDAVAVALGSGETLARRAVESVAKGRAEPHNAGRSHVVTLVSVFQK